MTWRNINDEVADLALRYSLQMRTDRIHMDALNELSLRLQDRPRLLHKLFKVASGFLRFQSPQLELWLAQEVFPVARFLHRRAGCSQLRGHLLPRESI
jgi:hypothetical protein